MRKVAIVTGGSSGIGRAAAEKLAEKGCAVYEFSRSGEDFPGVSHITCDITDENAVFTAVKFVEAREGRIDILVNNAGFGISGACEMTPAELSHAQLEVNLFGADRVTRAVIPYMRAQNSGRIVFISSVAGIVPIPFQTWYSVSKSAVLSYALALQNEVRPFKISVCAVLPGDIATGFTSARTKITAGDDIYGGRIEKSVKSMEHDEIHGMAPRKIGAKIAKYALKKSSRPVIAVGFMYKAAAVLIKILPRRLSNFIVGRIYAA